MSYNEIKTTIYILICFILDFNSYQICYFIYAGVLIEWKMSEVRLDRNVTSNINKSGLFLIGLSGGAAVALTVICAPFVSPALRRVCLPYVPATPAQIDNVLSALKGRSGRLVDIGSGDGRIVLAAASAGLEAAGVELNPWLVWYSRLSALKAGLSSRTSFHRHDLWTFSLRPYNNIVIFGVEEMMDELEQKMKCEVCEDTHVVACRFPLPSRTPDRTIGCGVDTVWLYRFR